MSIEIQELSGVFIIRDWTRTRCDDDIYESTTITRVVDVLLETYAIAIDTKTLY